MFPRAHAEIHSPGSPLPDVLADHQYGHHGNRPSGRPATGVVTTAPHDPSEHVCTIPGPTLGQPLRDWRSGADLRATRRPDYHRRGGIAASPEPGSTVGLVVNGGL